MKKISICSTTYNHSNFICEAVDSFLAQQINCEYEIIVADDASQDNTAEILKRYEEQYPGTFKAIHQPKNKGPIGNFIDVLTAATGEYVAYCDGDDYWTNSTKLARQINALELHSECAYSFHDVAIVDQLGNFSRRHSSGRINQHWKEGVYDSREVVRSPLTTPHANAVVFRREFLDLEFLRSLGKISAGDYPLTVMLSANGPLYYFTEVMSAYRQQPFSISQIRGYAYNEILLEEIISTHKKIDVYFGRQFHEEIRQHLKGQLMMKAHAEFDQSLTNRNLIGALKSFAWMVFKCRDTQYSRRDVLWLARQHLHKR